MVLHVSYLPTVQESEAGFVKLNHQLWNLLVDLPSCNPVRLVITNPLDQKVRRQSLFGLIGCTKDPLCFKASGKTLDIGLKKFQFFFIYFGFNKSFRV